MRILIYTPTNARAVDLQSVMELFVSLGHEVFLLSQSPMGDLHTNAQKYGVQVFSSGGKNINGIKSYLYNINYLKKFIRNHHINVVFAHLQGAGLIAGIVSKSVKFKLFYIRHNTDEHKLQKNRNAIVLNWLTNKVTSAIIAPSEKVYNYLTKVEKIRPSRVMRINYGYNFNQYLQTDRLGTSGEIREQYNCQLLLVSVARLVPAKRHVFMFEVVKELLARNMDVKLICISDGPSRGLLETYLNDHGLTKNIFLLGVKKNVFDYLEAADVFFHLSQTEASNSAVKEAGFCKRTAIVCNDVGDFDDYIKSGVNGFLVDKSDPRPESVTHLANLYEHRDKVRAMGENLYQTIIGEFEIGRVKEVYDHILKN